MAGTLLADKFFGLAHQQVFPREGLYVTATGIACHGETRDKLVASISYQQQGSILQIETCWLTSSSPALKGVDLMVTSQFLHINWRNSKTVVESEVAGEIGENKTVVLILVLLT